MADFDGLPFGVFMIFAPTGGFFEGGAMTLPPDGLAFGVFMIFAPPGGFFEGGDMTLPPNLLAFFAVGVLDGPSSSHGRRHSYFFLGDIVVSTISSSTTILRILSGAEIFFASTGAGHDGGGPIALPFSRLLAFLAIALLDGPPFGAFMVFAWDGGAPLGGGITGLFAPADFIVRLC
jgi:hypothetical protein